MKKFSGEHENLDTELNIVPIIDCFVMLICFLLFTAAFTQLVFLEAKLTSNTAAAAAKSRSELDQFRLVIAFEDSGLRLTTTGSAAVKINTLVPNIGSEYDFKSLHGHLIQVKAQHPARYSADIEFKTKKSAQVDYEKVMMAIDTIRHLSDEEYGAVRVAQKKIRQMELNDIEQKREVPENLSLLAQNLISNETSKNADHKLLFPDIAMVGID